MPKTTFIRKPSTLAEVQERTYRVEKRHDSQPVDIYYVAQEVQLEANEFFDLCDDLVSEREWIRTFSNQLHPMQDGAVAAIRVTCAHALTVLIIDPQGFDYPRYVGLESALK